MVPGHQRGFWVVAAAAPLLQSAGMKMPRCFEFECPSTASSDYTGQVSLSQLMPHQLGSSCPQIHFALWSHSLCWPLGRQVMGTSCSDPSREQGSSAGLCLQKHLPLPIVYPPWTQKNDYNQIKGSSFTPASMLPANFWMGFVEGAVLLLTCVSLLS